MRSACLPLFVLACAVTLAVQGCGENPKTLHAQDINPPADLQAGTETNAAQTGPSPDSINDPSAPPLDMRITKSMLYAAAMKHHVNPYLVMGLAWHESGWQASVVSSAGAVGIMQVMPATADADGPVLLNRN